MHVPLAPRGLCSALLACCLVADCWLAYLQACMDTAATPDGGFLSYPLKVRVLSQQAATTGMLGIAGHPVGTALGCQHPLQRAWATANSRRHGLAAALAGGA